MNTQLLFHTIISSLSGSVSFNNELSHSRSTISQFYNDCLQTRGEHTDETWKYSTPIFCDKQEIQTNFIYELLGLYILFIELNLTKTSPSESRMESNDQFIIFLGGGKREEEPEHTLRLLNNKGVSNHVTLISHPTLISWCRHLLG